MTDVERQPDIVESFFEHRLLFSRAWVDLWPNPIVPLLMAALGTSGVELSDFSLNKDAANLGEIHLNVSIRRLNAAARIGLDSITFVAANPDWELAAELVAVFDALLKRFAES